MYITPNDSIENKILLFDIDNMLLSKVISIVKKPVSDLDKINNNCFIDNIYVDNKKKIKYGCSWISK